jgi:hypothetical protein
VKRHAGRALPEAADTPLLGKKVAIHGLVAKPELNGLEGRAFSYDDAKGRYGVRIDSREVSIKPQNLTEVEERLAEGSKKGDPLTAFQKDIADKINACPNRGEEIWVFRRAGYDKTENPDNELAVIRGGGDFIAPLDWRDTMTNRMMGKGPMFKTADLDPTVDEILKIFSESVSLT